MKIERIKQALQDGDYMIIDHDDEFAIDVDFITVAKYNQITGLTFIFEGFAPKMLSNDIKENVLRSIEIHKKNK